MGALLLACLLQAELIERLGADDLATREEAQELLARVARVRVLAKPLVIETVE